VSGREALEAADAVTLCVTSAGRPDLLAATLSSLMATHRDAFAEVIVIDDLGDPEAARVARSLCPGATVLLNRRPRGHLRSVDLMYRHVRTPFIFHCEDDWRFDPVPIVGACREALRHLASASTVIVRKPEDVDPHYLSGARTEFTGGTPVLVLSPSADPVFNGFSFNPGLLRVSLWRRHGPWGRFRREHDISVAMKARGLGVVQLARGACVHIGGGRHVKDPFQRLPSRPLPALGRRFVRPAWETFRHRVRF